MKEEEIINEFPKMHTQNQLDTDVLKVVLSDFIKMKFGMLDELSSRGDFQKMQEFFESEEYNKFQTIQDLDSFEDENGNEFVLFFDDSKEYQTHIVYSVNVETLEVDILLIENDFKAASRFFYGFKYSDKYFEVHDNLDDNEGLMSDEEDGVRVCYVQKFENNEIVSTIELNQYRLSKGLNPIDYDPFKDMYKGA